MNRIGMTVIVVSLALFAVAGLVLADDGYRAPERDMQFPWAAIGYGLIFVLLAAVAGFKHSRRTHLD